MSLLPDTDFIICTRMYIVSIFSWSVFCSSSSCWVNRHQNLSLLSSSLLLLPNFV